jgi:radical SAM protein with 4Fe4S-binding SPASM domain
MKLASYMRVALGILDGSRSFGGPLQANLTVSNRCNLRCKHCYVYSPLAGESSIRAVRARLHDVSPPSSAAEIAAIHHLDVDADWMKELVGDFRRLGTRRFQFSGNGELFMHPRAVEILGFAKQSRSHVLVNTNGVLLEPDVIDRLITMKLDEIRITLMAGSPELYASLHPSASADAFDKVTRQLLYLQQRKRTLGTNTPLLTLVAIVVSENCGGLLDFAQYACRAGANLVLYKAFDAFDKPGLTTLIPTNEQQTEARKQLAEAMLLLQQHRISHNITAFLPTFRPELDTGPFYRRVPCYYGWLATCIDLDGRVFFCSRCDKPLGNAHDEPFSSIWNSEAYRRRRRQALEICRRGWNSQDSDCAHCPHSFANRRVFRMFHPLSEGHLHGLD